MAKLMTETKVRTNEVRFGFVNINPTSENGSIDKTNITIIIPKSDTETIKVIEEATENAIKAGTEKFGSSFKKSKIHTPLHDGDDEKPGNDAYTDCMYLNCSSKDPVGMVDASAKKMSDTTEFYSGMYGRITLNLAPYQFNGSGIGAYVVNVQKLRDGEALGFTRASAEDDFSDTCKDFMD